METALATLPDVLDKEVKLLLKQYLDCFRFRIENRSVDDLTQDHDLIHFDASAELPILYEDADYQRMLELSHIRGKTLPYVQLEVHLFGPQMTHTVQNFDPENHPQGLPTYLEAVTRSREQLGEEMRERLKDEIFNVTVWVRSFHHGRPNEWVYTADRCWSECLASDDMLVLPKEFISSSDGDIASFTPRLHFKKQGQTITLTSLSIFMEKVAMERILNSSLDPYSRMEINDRLWLRFLFAEPNPFAELYGSGDGYAEKLIKRLKGLSKKVDIPLLLEENSENRSEDIIPMDMNYNINQIKLPRLFPTKLPIFKVFLKATTEDQINASNAIMKEGNTVEDLDAAYQEFFLKRTKEGGGAKWFNPVNWFSGSGADNKPNEIFPYITEVNGACHEFHADFFKLFKHLGQNAPYSRALIVVDKLPDETTEEPLIESLTYKPDKGFTNDYRYGESLWITVDSLYSILSDQNTALKQKELINNSVSLVVLATLTLDPNKLLLAVSKVLRKDGRGYPAYPSTLAICFPNEETDLEKALDNVLVFIPRPDEGDELFRFFSTTEYERLNVKKFFEEWTSMPDVMEEVVPTTNEGAGKRSREGDDDRRSKRVRFSSFVKYAMELGCALPEEDVKNIFQHFKATWENSKQNVAYQLNLTSPSFGQETLVTWKAFRLFGVSLNLKALKEKLPKIDFASLSDSDLDERLLKL